MGRRAEPGGAEATQQRGESDVGADEPEPTTDAGEHEIGGAEHTHTVDVDHLMIDHVIDQLHLVVAP